MLWRASVNAVEANDSAEPKKFQEAVNSPYRVHWRKVIRTSDASRSARCGDCVSVRPHEVESILQCDRGVELDDGFDCVELLKTIYGLKQDSRVWNEISDEHDCSIGFHASSYDPCPYIKIVNGECVLLLVYVDDVLITVNRRH